MKINLRKILDTTYPKAGNGRRPSPLVGAAPTAPLPLEKCSTMH